MRPMADSLTQHGTGDSIEDQVTDFGVQIGFEALIPSKTGFWKISPVPLLGANIKNIFPDLPRL